MSVEIRGKADGVLAQFRDALEPYAKQHSAANIVIYRQNSVSVRIRIVDSDFVGVSKAERHERIWKLLEHLDDELLAEMSILLLLTPQEASKSFANLEFDDPVPSRI